MKIHLFLSLVFGAVLCAQTPEGNAPSAPEIYRDFLVALVKSDKAAVIRLALPNKEMSVLLSDGPIPAEHQKAAISQIEANPYRVLKVGETFRLPNGRTLSPTEEMEKKGWIIIASSGDPLPHMLQKTEDGWRVDAGDLIAARKAIAQQKK
jgi:hypothetical protein